MYDSHTQGVILAIGAILLVIAAMMIIGGIPPHVVGGAYPPTITGR